MSAGREAWAKLRQQEEIRLGDGHLFLRERYGAPMWDAICSAVSFVGPAESNYEAVAGLGSLLLEHAERVKGTGLP